MKIIQENFGRLEAVKLKQAQNGIIVFVYIINLKSLSVAIFL